MLTPTTREQQSEYHENEGDLTPMIDIVFLLLIFFILTTTFTEPEKSLRSLLSTPNGSGLGKPVLIEKNPLHVRVYPSSNGEERVIYIAADARTEAVPLSLSPEQQLERVHNFVFRAMKHREQIDVARINQDPITIESYTHLPWKWALWAMDAARTYEAIHKVDGGRSIAFGSVPIRSAEHDFDIIQLERLRDGR